MRLTHVRLLVDDFSAAYRFYSDVLGLETAWEDNGAYAEFRAGDAVMLAILPRSELPDDEGAVLCFDVADVDQAAATVRSHGGSLLAEPHDRAEWGLRVAHLRDPDDNLVELNRNLPAART